MDAKAYAARNRAGHDWFGHSDENTVQEIKDAGSNDLKAAGEQISKTAMIKPVCNSNQWFKHESDQTDGAKQHFEATAPPEQPNVGAQGDAVNGNAKVTHDQNLDNHSKATKEGIANCQRDKASSDWFSHHDPSKPVANPRAGSAESSNNALKMRNESENWFSHDPDAPPTPLHPSKGRPTNVRGNKDMYNIFHHGA